MTKLMNESVTTLVDRSNADVCISISQSRIIRDNKHTSSPGTIPVHPEIIDKDHIDETHIGQCLCD
jgi:hypothetical protein